MNRLEPIKVNVAKICLKLRCPAIALIAIIFVVKSPSGEAQAEVPKSTVTNLAIAVAQDRRAYEEQNTDEEYEQRNNEIIPPLEVLASSIPDNAALLYYQAFLLRPDSISDLKSKLYIDYEGIEHDSEFKEYLERCLPMIELVEVASQIPNCTWGTWQGLGSGRGPSVIALRSEIDYLSRIVLVDGLRLAAEGDYRMALEHCLIIRRLARQLSKDSKLYLIAHEPNTSALLTVQHVLGVMPPDADILTWFRGQLAVVQGPSLSFADRLQKEVGYYLDHFRTKSSMRHRIRDLLVESAEGEQAKEKIRSFTDEQLLLYIRNAYEPYLNSIFKILDSEIAYEEKCSLMERIINNIEEKYGTDPLYYEVMIPMGMPIVVKDYSSFQVKQVAHINGLKAALEVYLTRAETGKLPDELPDGLPKDPFSGRDFVYEKTNEGFVLYSQSEAFPEYMKKWLEFKVR